LSANFISQTGNMLTMLAIPWFVLETTGSASRTGVTAAVGLLSVIPAGIFGGALADRLGFRRTSIVADLASCVTVAMIPLLYLTVGLAFWELLLLHFLSGILDVPGYIARQSLNPELSDMAGMPLERTNGIYQMTDRMAGLVGPLLSGGLIAVVGASNVLWFDALTFIASAGIVASSVRVAERPAAPAGEQRASYFAEVLEGLRFIRRDAVLFPLVLTAALAGMLAEPVWSVIMPVYAREVYGSAVDLGIIVSALAAGSLVGNLVYIALGHRLPRRSLIIVAFACRVAVYWIFVPFPPLLVIAASVAAGAVVFEPLNPLLVTIFQERVPAELRGRVFGVLGALSTSVRPLGFLTYGLLIDQIGLRETVIVLACVNMVVPLILLSLPALHKLQPPVADSALAKA
jgi:MFS family permease